jgi:hypothetical protein
MAELTRRQYLWNRYSMMVWFLVFAIAALVMVVIDRDAHWMRPVSDLVWAVIFLKLAWNELVPK